MSYLRPLHAGISVANIEESIKWYQDVLDFELLWVKDVPPLNCTLGFIKHGDFEIELFQHNETIALPSERREPNSDIQTQGTKHIAFETMDIESLFNKFKEKNVDIVFGPVLQPLDGKTMGFIRDNNGTLLEFIQPTK